MNLVWKDVFVEEANISHHVAILRKSFGGENGKKLIQTIPCKGYRFVIEEKFDCNEASEIACAEQSLTQNIEQSVIKSNSFSVSADTQEMIVPIAESNLKNPTERIVTVAVDA